MSRSRNWLTIFVIVAVSASLAACAPERDNTVPMPVPTSTASASPSAGPEPEPDPTLLPGGSALANRDYFDFVNQRLLSVNKNPSHDAVVQNLVAAGFPKGDLEVTSDKTSELRRPSDSIEFSVRSGENCLIGQFEASKYYSTVGPALSGGRCLIGKTVDIK